MCIKGHITTYPGTVILIVQCYRYGSTLWGVSGGGLIKLYITAKAGLFIWPSNARGMDPPYEGSV